MANPLDVPNILWDILVYLMITNIILLMLVVVLNMFAWMIQRLDKLIIVSRKYNRRRRKGL
jgi:hypothetical protein